MHNSDFNSNSDLSSILHAEENKLQAEIAQLNASVKDACSKNDYKTAVSLLEKVLELAPNSSEAKQLLDICRKRVSAGSSAAGHVEGFRFGNVYKSVRQLMGFIWKGVFTGNSSAGQAEDSPEQKDDPVYIRDSQKQVEDCQERVEDSQVQVEYSRVQVDDSRNKNRLIKSINGADFVFRWCPSGTFLMGSPIGESGRFVNEKQHQVTLSKGFWLMETPVTQKQWIAVMGGYPSNFKGDDFPVVNVSWNDCQDFCNRCARFGLSVQLPTEAQWEYACRAGSTTAFFWGDSLNGDRANCNGLFPCGTAIKGQYVGMTTPVRSYAPNAWGLYDMHGNVWEWCADWYGDYPSWNVTDPVGPSNGVKRVYRGGSSFNYARFCRSSCRNYAFPDYCLRLGFRCVKRQ